MKKKVGFFGGTFDPIHFGHINLALQLFEAHDLDEVLFCPAYCSPLKKEAPPHENPNLRLEMVRLAVEDIPHFRFTNYEVDRHEISFTIETIHALLRERQVQFHLLLSKETAISFETWKRFEELASLAPPFVGVREALSSCPKQLQHRITITKIFDISSTDVRKRLKKKLYCGHLVPKKVLDYIEANELYI